MDEAVRLFLYLYQIVDIFVDERFRSLKRRDTLVQSGPVLPLPSHERLHPRKGRAIFSRHPLGVSHSCLFRAISIRPRVQRREKTSGKSRENVERGEREKKAEHLVLVISTRLGYTMRVRMRRRALGWISLSSSLFPLPFFLFFFFFFFLCRAICLRVPPPSSTCHEGRKGEGKSRGKKRIGPVTVACV